MIELHKLREVVRLLLLPSNLTHTYIGKLSGCPRQTVSEINKKLCSSDINNATIDLIDDDELQRKIYPKMADKRRFKVDPPFNEIIAECLQAPKRLRKTIWAKFCEYKQMYGDKGYARSRFYQLLAEYIKCTRLSMLQMYAPGEVMFIDYAGSTLTYQEKGQNTVTYAFVATLGYSKKRFAFATKDMSAQSWIQAIIAAIDFFGGVPEVIHCDNARAMVKKSGLLAELSHSAKEFAKHYDVLIDTSQVATPTHNPLAENRVKELTHSIFATMNSDLTFFSVGELNTYLKTEVEKRNTRTMQRIGLSANDLFFSDELPQMSKIPSRRFVPVTYRSTVKVPENYFVFYKHNRYSVPYEFRNEYVEMRVKGNKLFIVHKGVVRVIHDIVDGKNNVVSIDSHLHPAHRAQRAKTKAHYLAWAKGLGEPVIQVVRKLYARTKHDHSRPVAKRCMALMKSSEKFGSSAFIAACEHALKFDMVSATEIELILKSKVYDVVPEVHDSSHANLRGQDYYAGGQNEHL